MEQLARSKKTRKMRVEKECAGATMSRNLTHHKTHLYQFKKTEMLVGFVLTFCRCNYVYLICQG